MSVNFVHLLLTNLLMIFSYYLKRLLRQPTCVIGRRTRLCFSAKIDNISSTSNTITIGSNSIIKGQLLVFPHGGSIDIGDWCYLGDSSRLWSSSSIRIGDRVVIAHNVNIFDSQTHPISAELRHQHFRQISLFGHPVSIALGEKPVHICDDVWLAAGATILRGVTVGTGAIVGAGSVVTQDVPPWTMVAGNPAKIVRRLNPEQMTNIPLKP